MKRNQETTVQVKYLIESRSSIDIDPESFRSPATGKLGMIPFESHRDGSFTIRESYYYAGGKTPAHLIARLETALEPDYNVKIIAPDDIRANWPKYSYYEVRFSVTPKA